MLQVTQLESGQVRFESTADCLASELALFSITLGCFPWTGMGGVWRATQVRGTAWAKVWQGKCLMTNEVGVEEAEKRNEGWECWAGVWWALVAIEAKSELDPYSSWLSVASS